MKLQLIVSELQQIPDPLDRLRAKFDECSNITAVNTVSDIDVLNNMLAGIDSRSLMSEFERFNLTTLKTHARLAKTYFDPNSFSDNFI